MSAEFVIVKTRPDTRQCSSGRVLQTQTAVGVVAARENRPKSCYVQNVYIHFICYMPQNTCWDDGAWSTHTLRGWVTITQCYLKHGGAAECVGAIKYGFLQSKCIV